MQLVGLTAVKEYVQTWNQEGQLNLPQSVKVASDALSKCFEKLNTPFLSCHREIISLTEVDDLAKRISKLFKECQSITPVASFTPSLVINPAQIESIIQLFNPTSNDPEERPLILHAFLLGLSKEEAKNSQRLNSRMRELILSFADSKQSNSFELAIANNLYNLLDLSTVDAAKTKKLRENLTLENDLTPYMIASAIKKRIFNTEDPFEIEEKTLQFLFQSTPEDLSHRVKEFLLGLSSKNPETFEMQTTNKRFDHELPNDEVKVHFLLKTMNSPIVENISVFSKKENSNTHSPILLNFKNPNRRELATNFRQLAAYQTLQLSALLKRVKNNEATAKDVKESLDNLQETLDKAERSALDGIVFSLAKGTSILRDYYEEMDKGGFVGGMNYIAENQCVVS